jgi:hypothetical protein
MNGSTVAYIVDLDYQVARSTTPTALWTLYNSIIADQNPAPAQTLAEAIAEANDVIAKMADGTATDTEIALAISHLQAALNRTTNATVDQIKQVASLIDQLNGEGGNGSTTGTPTTEDEMVAAFDAYALAAEADKAAALEAAYQAAQNYTKSEAGNTDADAAYDALVALAADAAAKYLNENGDGTAEITSFAEIKAVIDAAPEKLSDAAASLLSDDTKALYDAAQPAVDTAIANYNYAKAVVDAYDAWTKMVEDGVSANNAQRKAAWTTFENACKDILNTDNVSAADLEALEEMGDASDDTFVAEGTGFTTALAAYTAGIDTVALASEDVKATLSGDNENGYEIQLAQDAGEVDFDDDDDLDMGDWLTVTVNGGEDATPAVWEKDTSDATGHTYIVFDPAAAEDNANRSVKVVFVDYTPSTEAVVATIAGRKVTNNAVTLAASEAELSIADDADPKSVIAGSNGTVTGISLNDADEAEGENKTLTLLTGANTLYVTVQPEDMNEAPVTLTITVTVQG